MHADASSFAEGVTKEEAYRQVLEQAEGLFADQRNWVRLSFFFFFFFFFFLSCFFVSVRRGAGSCSTRPSRGFPRVHMSAYLLRSQRDLGSSY